jgi:hypothetical protein
VSQTQITFHTILTHAHPHQDEGWAMLLLKRFGGKKYPCIETAGIEITDNPQSIDAAALLKAGIVCVGCGNGDYDEHGSSEYTCAAEMVAKDLGIAERREISNNIAYVKYCDRERDVRPHELPSLIKRWYRMHPGNQTLVIDRMMAILSDELDQSIAFQKSYAATKPDRKYFPLLGMPEGAPARSVCYAVFLTDDTNVPTIARLKAVDVVIVKNSRGNVQIFTKSNRGEDRTELPVVDIADAVRLIRMQEMRKAGDDPSSLTPEYLRQPDTLPESPRWHYLANGQTLLNGSDLAARDAEPTILPLEDIVQAIKVGCRPLHTWHNTQMADALQTVIKTI